MKSVSGKHWEEISVNKRLIDKVKIDHKFSDLISKSIVYRNFSNREIYSINNDVDLSLVLESIFACSRIKILTTAS